MMQSYKSLQYKNKLFHIILFIVIATWLFFVCSFFYGYTDHYVEGYTKNINEVPYINEYLQHHELKFMGDIHYKYRYMPARRQTAEMIMTGVIDHSDIEKYFYNKEWSPIFYLEHEIDYYNENVKRLKKYFELV